MRRWIALAGVACLGLAALSLLTPSVPTTDPWGWIVWGREVLHLDLDTSSDGSPSWKPLPVLLTTPLALFGDAAPSLWVMVARAGGLAGLLLLGLLAARLAGRRVGPVAAVVAVGALVLSHGWLRAMLHGYSEPMVVGLLAGAALLHLHGRRTPVLVLLVLAGLARPELWAVIGVYSLWALRTRAIPLPHVAGLLAPIPLLWFGGDLWGSGNALHGSQEAASINRLRGEPSVGDLISDAFADGLWAILALALAAPLVAWRERAVAVLSGACAAYFGFLCLLVVLGYPASARFMEPLMGMLCVLAGAGAGRLVSLALERRRALVRVAGPVAAAALVALVAADRIETVGPSVEAAHDRALLQRHLRTAVDELGPARIRECGAPIIPNQVHWNEGALAWELDAHFNEVREVKPWNATGGNFDQPLLMLAPAGVELAVAPQVRVDPRSERAGWRTLRLTTRPAAAACPL